MHLSLNEGENQKMKTYLWQDLIERSVFRFSLKQQESFFLDVDNR